MLSASVTVHGDREAASLNRKDKICFAEVNTKRIGVKVWDKSEP